MFGQQHSLSQKPAQGKIIAGLSFPQLAVVLFGAKLSYEFSEIVPALPVKNIVFAHVHHLIPLFLAFFAVFARDARTGLPVAAYFYNWLLFKARRKIYVWRRT
ncbi:MAG: hypothetical protein K6U74_03140 [Firmicutes bacterium]|nr:hypothetical protein [Bacillota bacterium]